MIKAVESFDEASDRVAALLDSGACVTSELTRAEALVGAFREQSVQPDLAVDYEHLFADARLEAMPIDRTILTHAARLRAADLSLKLPDAIHLASAISGTCEILLSADKKLLAAAGREGLDVCSLELSDLDALLARIAPAR